MANLFTRHPLVLQTAFAELKRQAMEQEFLLVGTPGSVGPRTIKGSRYLYRQFYDAQGKKAADYIGAESDSEAEKKAARIRNQIELTKELLRQSRILGQQGYVRADRRTGSILAALVNHGLFDAGAILVGSHAFGSLLNLLGVSSAAFFTEDVDIARPQHLEIALDDETGFLEILRDSTVPLNPIPALRRGAASTSYKPPGVDRLRVDLLVPAPGDEIGIREVRDLKAHATSLPYLGYLIEKPIDGLVLGKECVAPLRIPRPERFAWHKMLVSRLRDSTSEKRQKDVWQAAVMVAVLAEEAPEDLVDAFGHLPAGARARTTAGAEQVRMLLEKGGHERALEVLQEALN